MLQWLHTELRSDCLSLNSAMPPFSSLCSSHSGLFLFLKHIWSFQYQGFFLLGMLTSYFHAFLYLGLISYVLTSEVPWATSLSKLLSHQSLNRILFCFVHLSLFEVVCYMFNVFFFFPSVEYKQQRPFTYFSLYPQHEERYLGWSSINICWSYQ